MNEIEASVHEIIWSLWSELGVPGGTRNHSHLLLDPEPIIVCTPHLSSGDPRLTGLSFDWCAAHAGLLSKSRIKALSQTFDKAVTSALAGFNGALKSRGILWAPAAEPGPWRVNRTVVALPLERPALLRLRMRTLTGVSSRAELLTELTASRQNSLTVEELTVSGISRRSTDRVLAELLQGGFVVAHGKKRGRKFSLSDRSAFTRLLGLESSDPTCIPVDWQRVFQAIVQIDALPRLRVLSDALRRVEACRIRDELATHMMALHRTAPPILAGRSDAFDCLFDWATAQMDSWARGDFSI